MIQQEGIKISKPDGDYVIYKGKLIKFLGYNDQGNETYLVDGKICDSYDLWGAK